MPTKLCPSVPHLTSDISTSFALSIPSAHFCPILLFQCSYFLVSSLFSAPFPNVASLHPSPDTLHSHFSVYKTWGVCRHLQTCRALEKQTQSFSNQVSTPRRNFINGSEGHLLKLTWLGNTGTFIHKFRTPNCTAWLMRLFFPDLPSASCLKALGIGAGALPSLLGNNPCCCNSNESK